MKLPIINTNVGLGTGLAIGLGAAVLVPVVFPIVGALVKPVAKGAIKGGMMLAHQGKVMAAEIKESVEDITAEAKAELAAASMAEPAAPKKKA
jgi:uncharacterized membrane protein